MWLIFYTQKNVEKTSTANVIEFICLLLLILHQQERKLIFPFKYLKQNQKTKRYRFLNKNCGSLKEKLELFIFLWISAFLKIATQQKGV